MSSRSRSSIVKWLVFSNLITFSVVIGLMAGCSGEQGEDQKEKTTRQGIMKVGDPGEGECPSTDYSDHIVGLNAMLALDMARNYRNNHLAAIQQHMTMGDGSQGGDGDSRSVWFSLDVLKRFIHDAEQYTCDSCPDGKLLGVRIYYGEYPDKDRWTAYKTASNALGPIADKNLYYYHSVVMVPTYRDKDKDIDIDFDPRHWSGPCTPKGMTEVFRELIPADGQPADAGSLFALLGANNGDESPVYMQNHGALIPPPYSNFSQAGAQFLDLVDQQ